MQPRDKNTQTQVEIKIGLCAAEAMTNNLNVYYNQVVDPRFVADEGAQITFGDMHGNSMKLIAEVLKHDVLRISTYDINILSYIYNLPIDDLTPELYAKFCSIIDSAEVNPSARKATLRFIGDEFADRGRGDHFTMPIFKKLNKEGIHWYSCASNHTMELITCYELKDYQYKTRILKNGDVFARSMGALKTCTNKGIISQNEVDTFFETHYLPHLKIADYTINEHQDMTQYLHAPFDSNTIKSLAQQLGCNYNPDDSIIQQKQQLDHLQNVFQTDYVKNKFIHQLLNLDESEDDSEPNNNHAFFDSIWNRERKGLAQGVNSKRRYVNGHDTPIIDGLLNVCELDNELGKEDLKKSNLNVVHPYTALYTHENQNINNSLFTEASTIQIRPSIIAYFNPGDIEKHLLQKDKIYSRFQIKTLQLFLSKSNALSKWKKILPINSKLYSDFINALDENYEIWDVMRLLNKYKILNTANFSALIDNHKNAENIYQVLVILGSLGLLNADNNIHQILTLDHENLIKFHDYLIELQQYQCNFNDKLSFKVDILSVMQKSISLLTQQYASLNYINITCHNFSAFINKQVINNIFTTVDKDEDIDIQDRICDALETYYKERCTYENKKNNLHDLNQLVVNKNYHKMSATDKLEALSRHFKFEEECDRLSITTISSYKLKNNLVNLFEYAYQFQYRINNQIKLTFGNLSELKSINDIYLNIKNLENNFFEKVFSHDALLEIIKLCVIITDLDKNAIEYLNDFVCCQKKHLSPLIEIFTLLKRNEILKETDIEFILTHDGSVTDLIECIKVYGENVNIKIWNQLKDDIDEIDELYIETLKATNLSETVNSANLMPTLFNNLTNQAANAAQTSIINITKLNSSNK